MVVLPHIIEASEAEFGYAAVQAISAWRFEPPRQNGQAVDTVVRVPIEFKARPNPESPSG
jgi:TonB family protein